MRIDGSSVVMESTRTAVSYARQETTVTAWAQDAPVQEDRVELCGCREGEGGRELGKDLDLKEWLAALLWRELFGSEPPERPGVRRGQQQEGEAAPPGRRLSGVEVHVERIAYEAESVSVRAAGVVTTADGRRIELGMALDMSREHLERTTLDLAFGDARPRKDPLVINLAGGAATLGGPRNDLDLDGDGTKERIATPSGGSAFLAVDGDGDGAITSGAELLGPRTGDGFRELAALDGDGDGWVDEDDAGWARLRVWDTTTGSLLTLREAGVGALFTGAVRSDFALGATAATADGFVAKTGVFLREDGGAGTVQHVDLVV